MIGYFRDIVGIGHTARSQAGQDLFEPMRLEADQVEVETAEFQVPQLTAKQIAKSSMQTCSRSSVLTSATR